jgi:ATP-dependent protease ClpP protease subunit
MIILEWNGEIGWELWTGKIKGDLKTNSGEDLTIRFSSIGGDIFEGADIMTMLANHKKDNPGIKMNLELGGVAASMGSAIASSPVWDNITVESLTAHMIHRPSSFVYGDHEDMRARADFLEKANNVYAQLYSTKSGTPVEEIQTLMKDTTWLFGQEIVDAGFADSVAETEQTGDKDMIITGMKNKFSKMCDNQAKLHEGENFDTVKAAACFKMEVPTMKTVKTVKAETIKPTPVGNSSMEVPMTEEELMKDNPTLVETLMKKGAEQEKEANSARVKSLTEMKGKEEYKSIPEVVEVIDKCIEDGTEMSATQPLIMAAMMKIMADPARMASLESPEDITGGDTKPTEIKTKQSAEV